MTIRELLETLDGAGLIITDDDLIDETLSAMGLSQDTEIIPTNANTDVGEQAISPNWNDESWGE